MSDRSFERRVWITAGVLVGGLVLLHGVSNGERIPTPRPLREVPLALGEWNGRDSPMDREIVEALGVDDYLSRIYVDSGGNSVAVYVGYYSSQRTGDTIHSPKNCLPGSGWEPVRSGRVKIEVPNSPPIVVNEYLIEKGLERDLVLYWYEGRGRVVASEYWGKVWQVVDAITRNRTDGALVRVLTPAGDGEGKAARASAVEFVQALYPRLSQYLPN